MQIMLRGRRFLSAKEIATALVEWAFTNPGGPDCGDKGFLNSLLNPPTDGRFGCLIASKLTGNRISRFSSFLNSLIYPHRSGDNSTSRGCLAGS